MHNITVHNTPTTFKCFFGSTSPVVRMLSSSLCVAAPRWISCCLQQRCYGGKLFPAECVRVGVERVPSMLEGLDAMRPTMTLIPETERYLSKTSLFLLCFGFVWFCFFVFFCLFCFFTASQLGCYNQRCICLWEQVWHGRSKQHVTVSIWPVFVKMSGGFDSLPFTSLPRCLGLPITRVRW